MGWRLLSYEVLIKVCWLLAPSRLDKKKNNHLRVVVVSKKWSFENSVYVWLLYKFFVQKLPL